MKMLNDRIEIYRFEEQRVNGKPLYDKKLFYSCFCKIEQLFGSELYQAMNIQLNNTIQFKVRYSQKIKELYADKKFFKIKYDNIYYNIYQIDFTKAYKKYVIIKCCIKR